jgi:hypothetical protein
VRTKKKNIRNSVYDIYVSSWWSASNPYPNANPDASHEGWLFDCYQCGLGQVFGVGLGIGLVINSHLTRDQKV